IAKSEHRAGSKSFAKPAKPVTRCARPLTLERIDERGVRGEQVVVDQVVGMVRGFEGGLHGDLRRGPALPDAISAHDSPVARVVRDTRTCRHHRHRTRSSGTTGAPLSADGTRGCGNPARSWVAGIV